MSPGPGVLSDRRVVVVGGGVAGLAAACALAERGARVELRERRPFLGGKVFSFEDPGGHGELDNGQHVLLGCCDRLIAFLHRVGAWEGTRLQPRLDIPFVAPGGRVARLRASALPAPLHLAASFAAFPFLAAREKLAVAGAMAALRAMSEPARRALDGVSFAEWLRARGQGDGVVARFWDPVVLATLNVPSTRASAALAAMVFRVGLLSGRGGAAVGVAALPLSRWLVEPARRWLEAHGGRVVAGSRVAALEVEGGRAVRARTERGEAVEASDFVVALPPDRMLDLLPDPLRRDPFFARAAALGTAPIVSVHQAWDREVTDLPFACCLGGELQWVFDRGRNHGLPAPPQRLSLVVSGAFSQVDEPKPRLAARLEDEVRRLFPRARGARLLASRVVKEPRATFLAEPGSQAARLPARTPVRGLFLAGAWTDTGWPATMEGAVRSAEAAVAALAGGEGGSR